MTVSAEDFLELVFMYLSTTLVGRHSELFMQDGQVSIGTCITPFLSDLVMAEHDTRMNALLEKCGLKFFRYVEDFLTLQNYGENMEPDLVQEPDQVSLCRTSSPMDV